MMMTLHMKILYTKTIYRLPPKVYGTLIGLITCTEFLRLIAFHLTIFYTASQAQ